MASIRYANCMELRLVRVWHQAIACISPSPFVLDSMLALGEIKYESEKYCSRRKILDVLYTSLERGLVFVLFFDTRGTVSFFVST